MRVFIFADKMKLRSKLIFVGFLLLITHAHLATTSPRNLRTRSSTPSVSQENEEESAVSWIGSRTGAEQKNSTEPKSYVRRIDGLNSRRKIIPPIDMDIVPSGQDPMLPRSSKNIRRNDSRQKPSPETSFVQVTNNGAFSESRRARVLSTRQPVVRNPDEPKHADLVSRGHRQTAQARMQNPEEVPPTLVRSRQRKPARDFVEPSPRSGRLLSPKPPSVVIDESKLEILSLDMESGAINKEYDYNMAENFMKETTFDKVKTSSSTPAVILQEATSPRSRGRNPPLRSRGNSIPSRQRQGYESSTIENTTSQNSRSRSRGRIHHTAKSEMQTEPLFERTEKSVQTANFTPRTRKLTRATNPTAETSSTIDTYSRGRGRSNLRRTSAIPKVEIISSSENIRPIVSNRRSDILTTSVDEIPDTPSSETPLQANKRLRKKLVKLNSADSNQNSERSANSRGNARSGEDKGFSGSTEDYENENYPEHFKTLLLAKENAAKQSTPSVSTQETLSTKTSRLIINLYNPESSQSPNVLKAPSTKFPRFRALKTSPISPIDSDSVNIENAKETNKVNTVLKRKIKDNTFGKVSTSETPTDTSPITPRYARQHKFTASRYNGYKKVTTSSPVDDQPKTSLKPRRTPAFRSNLHSRTKGTTEKPVEVSTDSELESGNLSLETSSPVHDELLSTSTEVPKKYPQRFNKFKTLSTKVPLTTKDGPNGFKRLSTRTYQRRTEAPNVLDDSIKSSSQEDSKTLRQKFSSQVPNEANKRYNQFSSRYKAPLQKIPPVYQATVPTVTSTVAWLKFFVTDIPIADSLTEPVWFVAADGQLRGKFNHQIIRSIDHNPRVNTKHIHSQ